MAKCRLSAGMISKLLPRRMGTASAMLLHRLVRAAWSRSTSASWAAAGTAQMNCWRLPWPEEVT